MRYKLTGRTRQSVAVMSARAIPLHTIRLNDNKHAWNWKLVPCKGDRLNLYFRKCSTWNCTVLSHNGFHNVQFVQKIAISNGSSILNTYSFAIYFASLSSLRYFRIFSVLNQQQKVESLLGVYLYFFSISVFILLNKIHSMSWLNKINLAQHDVDF